MSSLPYFEGLSSSTGGVISNNNATLSHNDHDYFTSTERDVLWTVTICGASLSIAGTSLITLSYILYPSLRTFPFKLIVLMSLSDFWSSISYLIPTNGNDTACQVQAGMQQFFQLATFFWTGIFSWNIFEVLVLRRSGIEKREYLYHTIVWGLSGIILAINYAFNTFGPTLVWCWINSNHELSRLFSFYLPLTIIFFLNMILYVVIGKQLSPLGQEKQQAINSRLRQYLVVFFIVRIWSVINRLQNVIQPDNPIFALYFMHSFFSPLQGFCNSLVYGWNVRVRQRYLRCLCCKGWRSLEEGADPSEPLQQPSYASSPSTSQVRKSSIAPNSPLATNSIKAPMLLPSPTLSSPASGNFIRNDYQTLR